MGLISKSFTLLCAGAGLASFSQLPEYTQQYRQRLAGAVEELRGVVTDFDKDAQSSGLNRNEALRQMSNSTDAFPRDRGQSMERAINRFERLSAQQEGMENAEPVSRPLFLLTTYDEKLLKGSWDIFEPAVPLNAPGALWGGFGAFLLGFLARIPISLLRWTGGVARGRKGSDSVVVGGIKIEPQPQTSAELPLVKSGESSLNDSGQQVQMVSGRGTILDQIALEERIVGEVNASGHIVRKR